VRKVAVDKTRSSLERVLGTIKQKLEKSAGDPNFANCVSHRS
jgi:hypothetical protein